MAANTSLLFGVSLNIATATADARTDEPWIEKLVSKPGTLPVGRSETHGSRNKHEDKLHACEEADDLQDTVPIFPTKP